jgi:hypothetical protein
LPFYADGALSGPDPTRLAFWAKPDGIEPKLRGNHYSSRGELCYFECM